MKIKYGMIDNLKYGIIHDSQMIIEFKDRVLGASSIKEGMTEFFASLSLRKKYLTPEEREKYNIGNAEMFNREIFEYEDLLHTIEKMELPQGGYYFSRPNNVEKKTVLPRTPHLLTVYACLHPVDRMMAWTHTMAEMNDSVHKTMKGEMVQPKDPLKVYKTIAQQTTQLSKKTFADIDVDIPEVDYSKKTEIAKRIVERIERKNKERVKQDVPVSGFFVDTTSGFHLLLFKDSLKCDYMSESRSTMYTDFDYAGNMTVEVQKNKNEMIPLPGTYQPSPHGERRHPVTMTGINRLKAL